MIVSLVGLPGCGKSTVGRLAAKQLGWAFVDSDAVIEGELGHSIRDHFERFGEESFREREAQVIATLSRGDRLVLATGGGAVLRAATRDCLRAGGNRVVYLRATVDDLVRRLRQDAQRPLLQGVDHGAKLQELFIQRDPIYRAIAEFSVDTGRTSVAMIASRLVMQLELSGPSEPLPSS